jgi:hypothetical protein
LLGAANVDPQRRAESLTLGEWAALVAKLEARGSS